MKKKIIAAVLIVIIGFGAIQAKTYYDSRYVKDADYFVYIPMDQSTEIEDVLDDSGNVVDKGRSYSFVGLNEKGESRKLEFSYTTKDTSKLLQPDTYLKVSASKTIVLGQTIISKNEVPESIVEKLNSLN